MQILRSFLTIALVVAFAASVSAADPAKKAAKKGANVRGVVVAVDKDAGTITIKTQPNTKKDPNAVAEEKKFKLTETTKVEKIIGKPKDGEVKPAALGDVVKDVHVLVTVKNDTVESIKLVEGKKK